MTILLPVAYQIGAAQALAALAGHRLTHAKVHGALSNMACEDETIARAIARAAKAVDPNLAFLAIAGTELERAGEKENLAVAREIFADRAYTDEGLLVSRSIEGAVIHDAELAASRVLDMVAGNAVISQSANAFLSGSVHLRAWRYAGCRTHGQGRTPEARKGGVQD